MTSDEAILAAIDAAFADELRPEHFTDHPGCCECADHDDLLRSRDRETLALHDVATPAWDPIAMVTTEGWRYYLPSLVRIALENPPMDYLEQLLFHLVGDGPGNRRIVVLSEEQRSAVAAFLWHALETPAKGMNEDSQLDLTRAIEIWS